MPQCVYILLQFNSLDISRYLEKLVEAEFAIIYFIVFKEYYRTISLLGCFILQNKHYDLCLYFEINYFSVCIIFVAFFEEVRHVHDLRLPFVEYLLREEITVKHEGNHILMLGEPDLVFAIDND